MTLIKVVSLVLIFIPSLVYSSASCTDFFDNISLNKKSSVVLFPRKNKRPSLLPKQKLILNASKLAYKILNKEAPFSKREFNKIVKQLLQTDVIEIEIPIYRDNGRKVSVKAWRSRHSSAQINKGGVRATEQVDKNDVRDLSIGMSLKAQLFDLPYGGGKGGIKIPNNFSQAERARVYRGYVKGLIKKDPNAIGPFADSLAPDVGTSSQVMRIFLDQYLKELVLSKRLNQESSELASVFFKSYSNEEFLTSIYKGQSAKETPLLDLILDLASVNKIKVPSLGAFTGKAINEGGNVVREAATGLGVFIAAKIFSTKLFPKKVIDKSLSFALQALGNVGMHAALSIHDAGFSVKIASEYLGDGKFVVFRHKDRIDIPALLNFYRVRDNPIEEFVQKGLDVKITSEAEAIKILYQAKGVDVLIPAALENQIRKDNQHLLRDGLLIAEGANGPTSAEVSLIELSKRGIVVIPDFLANSGGVYSSYREWKANVSEVFGKEQSVVFETDLLISKMEDVSELMYDLWQTYDSNIYSIRDISLSYALSKLVKREVKQKKDIQKARKILERES